MREFDGEVWDEGMGEGKGTAGDSLVGFMRGWRGVLRRMGGLVRGGWEAGLFGGGRTSD